MSSSLGMPGPVPAAWMIARKVPKTAVRATILVLFVPSYGAALLGQALAPGIDRIAIDSMTSLLPATLLGILLGRFLEQRIGEELFRRIVVTALACTALGLLYDLLTRS